MKNCSIKICFILLLFFGSVSVGAALPACPGSYNSSTWTNCVGKKVFSDQSYYYGEFKNGEWHGKGAIYRTFYGKDIEKNCYNQGRTKDNSMCEFSLNKNYVGNWKRGRRHGYGIATYWDGTVTEGIWANDKFQYASKPTQPSHLRTAFKTLSAKQRKQIQSNLKGLGFYKSSIDGLYGKGTAGALTAYNKQNLNGVDLKKSENVDQLIDAVLALKPFSKSGTQPVPVAKAPTRNGDTYKVASGTGFYVSDAGHIITNHHVIDGCKNMKVHSKGKVLETINIAEDARNDLALLKISKVPDHVFALSVDSPYSLQEIVVAGFPFGDRVSSTLKFTQGIVSSIAGIGNDYSQIQIDAAIQPGNSGGPILDEYGNVVAVAVAKLSLKKIYKDYGVVPENTNFGVKASAVKNLMEGNGVSFKSPNTAVISRQKLSQTVTNGTVYLTCWMTTAQIDQMRSKKVLFEDLE